MSEELVQINDDTTNSLEDAFQMITSIVNSQRAYYEKTIEALNQKISDLESKLLESQNKIIKLQAKLRSVATTVTKMEESEENFILENKLQQQVQKNNSQISQQLNKTRNINDKNTASFRNGNGNNGKGNINNFGNNNDCFNRNNSKNINITNFHQKFNTEFKDFNFSKKDYLKDNIAQLVSANQLNSKYVKYFEPSEKTSINNIINKENISNSQIPMNIKKKSNEIPFYEENNIDTEIYKTYGDSNFQKYAKKKIKKKNSNSNEVTETNFNDPKLNNTTENIFNVEEIVTDISKNRVYNKNRHSIGKFNDIENKIMNMRTNLNIYNSMNQTKSSSGVINERIKSSTVKNMKKNIKGNNLFYEN